MFVARLLNFILKYKMFMRIYIKKKSKENGGNKVSMNMRIKSCVTTYYNFYF